MKKNKGISSVILLYVEAENNLVVPIETVIVNYSITLDEFMDIADLTMADIDNILGFEADYECLRLSVEGL